MIPFFIGFLTYLSSFFRSRYSLSLEILALRPQLGVLTESRINTVTTYSKREAGLLEEGDGQMA